MHHYHHSHDGTLVILSILIAIFASYTSLDLANSVSTAKGKSRWAWLLGGSLAMGIGIWSMHFIGMLAFNVSDLQIAYDVPLLSLSIFVAVVASALALYIICFHAKSFSAFTVGGLLMGTAIAGMHYIGIWSMRMAASIEWNILYVINSLLIAYAASFAALHLAFKLREDFTLAGFLYRGGGGVIMGIAISGMHYMGMAAMTLVPDSGEGFDQSQLLATDGLAASVIVSTVIILGIALIGSNIERTLTKKTALNDALREAVELRDDFLSIASHELRTPLTSVKLQNDMILRRLRQGNFDATKLLSMLEKTGKNLGRINRLVEDMLDISRFSSGKLSLNIEEFDISSLCQEVTERLHPLLTDAGCEIRINCNEVIMGSWDRFRIEQVLTNLLTNAAKYAGGSPIDVNLTSDGTEVMMMVRDHGPGVNEQDRERIFGRFERAKVNDTITGLGLGLFITREIVSMHKGSIEVLNAEGGGAEFVVTLPLKYVS